MKAPVSTFDIIKYEGSGKNKASDLIATEEPLEIRLKFMSGGEMVERRLAVTMRTPGHDFELAAGFLLTEGIINSFGEVEKIFYCENTKSEEEEGNVVIVHLKSSAQVDASTFERNFYINSSCGICGKTSLDSVMKLCRPILHKWQKPISEEFATSLSDKATQAQTVFRHTGGLHASTLFDASGNLLLLREDIGRHNALDKLIGARAVAGKNNTDTILFISGRAGFEMVQKAVMASIPVMMAVGAPSSLAIDLARKSGLVLIGFARKGRFNLYSGPGVTI